jgi:hypothetical protein
MRSLHVFLVENHKDTVKYISEYIQLFLEQLNYNVRFCSGLGEVSDCDVSIYIDIKRSLETCASVSERTEAGSLEHVRRNARLLQRQTWSLPGLL